MDNGIKEFQMFIELSAGTVPTTYAYLKKKCYSHIFEFKIIILVLLEHIFLLSEPVPHITFLLFGQENVVIDIP